jgi:hypothetical protein
MSLILGKFSENDAISSRVAYLSWGASTIQADKCYKINRWYEKFVYVGKKMV